MFVEPLVEHTNEIVMILSVVTCVCGALGRAHKRDCPMSSSSFPTEVYSILQKCIV